jgi:secreted trypsin-like serine protease
MRKWIIAAMLGSAPASAITVISNPSAFQAGPGTAILNQSGLTVDGIVKLITTFGSTSYGCTGALLANHYDILTAAHCVDPNANGVFPNSATAYFYTSTEGNFSRSAVSYAVNPGWDGDPFLGGDLALIRLNQVVASDVQGYNLYNGTGELTLSSGSTPVITLAGYGLSGLGTTGESSSSYPFGTRRQGENRYDTTAYTFGGSSGVLLGDFDNGTTTNDAFGAYDPAFANIDSDILNSEVMSAHGDSGGPSFLNGQIVGVHSFLTCFSTLSNPNACAVPPAVSTSLNASFGQIYGDMRVSSYAGWITQNEVPEPGTLMMLIPALGLLLATRHLRGSLPMK